MALTAALPTFSALRLWEPKVVMHTVIFFVGDFQGKAVSGSLGFGLGSVVRAIACAACFADE